MKKIFQITLLFGAALMFNACAGEEDDIFDNSAAERLNMASEKYTSLLEASEGGWVLQYYPTTETAQTTGQGYLWALKFNTDLSVVVGMNNYFTSNSYREASSAWEVITDNGPVLTFNSYNPNIHVFSDPDISSIPGSDDNVWGVGVGGDYEFVIVDAPEDHSYVMLKGKKRGTYNLLTPLPAGTDFQEYLADVSAFYNKVFPENAPNVNYLSLGGKRYVLSDANTGIFSMYPEGGDAITETSVHPFLITKRDGAYYLRFKSNFSRDDIADEDKVTLQEMVYDQNTEEFVSMDNSAYVIEGYPVGPFFSEYLLRSGSNRWNLTPTNNMSDKFKTYMDAVGESISAMKDNRGRSYLFNGFRFVYNNSDESQGYQWGVVYRPPNSSSFTAAMYDYDFTSSENGAAFVYQKPATTAATNVLNATNGLQEALNVFSQQFTITAAESKLNLSTLRLTSVSDPDIWFEVNI